MAGITDYRQIPPPSSMPEITFGERPHTPNLPPNTMTVPSGRGPSWEQGGRGGVNATPLPPPEFLGNPSGTSTPWGGPEISQAPDAFDPFAGMEAPQQERGPYSFLDNPGASDALVAFGAAMLKAPDFNTGLGDAALAVNRVARENRPIGEAEYARAKQLAMLDAIKRGKGGTGGSGKMEIDYSTAYTNGATPSQIYMGPAHKQQFSAFTGIADIRKDAGAGQATIVAGAEIYVSDFGELVAIPHPYGLTRDAPIVDPEMVSVAVLDGYKTQALAKTGDNERFMLTCEACLEVKNEKAHAVVADLT